MDIKTTEVFFALLRSAISGEALCENKLKKYSPDMLDDLLKVALDQDMLHLLALGMKQNGLIPEGDELGLGKCIFKAVYRYERLKYDYDSLCEILENAEVPFLPLKGSVIRQYYPEEWMRTSCDIDILLSEADAQKATEILTNEYGYTYYFKNSHNISLFSPNNVHIELHYELIEEGLANEASEVLCDVWNVVKLKDGFSYWYEMPDEMFYFYHIAHMAKHFENGGCGIRPLLDLWILDSMENADAKKREKLLEKGDLIKFALSACRLSKAWFADGEYDAVIQKMENYILQGGLFGSHENRIAFKQRKSGGKFKFALSRIFLPYDTIKYYYPVLEKMPWLTPVMEVRRWGKLIFCGHLKRTTEELRYSNNISGAEADEIKKFLCDIGL